DPRTSEISACRLNGRNNLIPHISAGPRPIKEMPVYYDALLRAQVWDTDRQGIRGGVMALGERGLRTQTIVAIQIAAFCVLLGTGAFLHGQSSNRQITGLVTDSTGAAVESAKITATNLATGVSYSNTSNGSRSEGTRLNSS